MKYKIFYLLSYVLILTIFFEVLSFIYIKFNRDLGSPSYNFTQRTHYLDINKRYGPWHIPNTSFRHKTECFDVNYKFNSIGARDDEFLKNEYGKKTIFLLGDSYAEGYGLKVSNTFDRILTNKLKTNILNFGVSGHFGTTQARILYDNFQNKYEHGYVLHIISVATDFEDDDYEFWVKNINTKKRYRPYLIKKNNNYEIIYTGKFNDSNSISELNLKSFLANFTNTFYVLKKLKKTISSFGNKKLEKDPINYYEEYDEDILDIFKFNLKKINKTIKENNRKYILVTMPDFYHLKKNTTKQPKLDQELLNFAKKENIIFIDLYAEIKKKNIDIQKLFNNNDIFDCDGHPNSNGSFIISELIYSKLKDIIIND